MSLALHYTIFTSWVLLCGILIFNITLYPSLFYLLQTRAERFKKRKVIFKRAEQYVREYRAKERDEIRLARQARNKGNYYVPADAKLAFIVRIRG